MNFLADFPGEITKNRYFVFFIVACTDLAHFPVTAEELLSPQGNFENLPDLALRSSSRGEVVNQDLRPLTDYQFDGGLLLGSSLGKDISRFNRVNSIDPGYYSLDLYINGQLGGNSTVLFRAVDDQTIVQPCFTERFFQEVLKVKAQEPLSMNAQEDQNCVALQSRLIGSSFKLDLARLRLDISIPQALLMVKPMGYVDVAKWDRGESMAFTNYDANFYQTRQSGLGVSNSEYAYLGLNSGINFGLWRFRHQSSLTYTNSSGIKKSLWSNLQTYVQRVLPDWKSELTLGESYTAGNLLGSLSYLGLSLASDDRLLPDSMRQYAPEVRGVAATSARVVISQNDRKIREINVAPGPFVISDLYGTASAGDLEVQVFEADGRISSFTVPFAALPESIRPGFSRYAFTVGQVRRHSSRNDFFSDLTYQRGLSNSLTANFGMRLAQNYLAVQSGGVWATTLGAIGVSATYSKAEIEAGAHVQGGRIGVTYNKTIQSSNTAVTLANYHYSTEGYRELLDVLGARIAYQQGQSWDSSTYKQRNQFTLMLTQSIGNYGSIYVSGSVSDFYGVKKRDTQIQLGYSHIWGQIGFSLTWSRQRNIYYVNDPSSINQTDILQQLVASNSLNLSVSIPLGKSKNSPNLSASILKNIGEKSSGHQEFGLNGSLGEDQAWGYAISASQEHQGGGIYGSGTLQKQSNIGAFSAGFSQGRDYLAFNGGVRGAAVLHQGGLTLGPYLGDSFALIEAKGAEGALVRGSSSGRVNSQGYALVPSLVPYRYNSVGLDPSGLNSNAELIETERKIVPSAGASVHVNFETLSGTALLIQSQQQDGKALPLGANVFNRLGVVIGMVGQGGQIYARTEEEQGQLLVRWGRTARKSCMLSYDLRGIDRKQSIIHLQADCVGKGNDIKAGSPQ